MVAKADYANEITKKLGLTAQDTKRLRRLSTNLLEKLNTAIINKEK